MGAFFTQLSDTLLEVRKEPSEYVQSLPTITQWSLWLKLARPEHAACFVAGDMSLTVFTCIACGVQSNQFPHATTLTGKRHKIKEPLRITIGAKVRKEKEDYYIRNSDGMNIIEKAQVPMPVLRKGIGCPGCMDKFAEQQTRAAHQHAIAERIDTLNALEAQLKGCKGCLKQYNECKCVKGFKPHTFKATTKYPAQITVLESPLCLVCKDTFHVWDMKKWNPVTKSYGDYVICDCYKRG